MTTADEMPVFKEMTNDEVTDWITDVMEEYGLCVEDTDFYDNEIAVYVETGNTYNGIDISLNIDRDITEMEFYGEVGIELVNWDAREWCSDYILETNRIEDVYGLVHDADDDAETFHEAGQLMLAHYRELRDN